MRPSCFSGDLGFMMSTRDGASSYSQKVVLRKFIHPANEDANFNPMTGELIEYDESINYTDILLYVNVLEYDKFKERVDDAYNSGPYSRLEIEVPKIVKCLHYKDFWLIRNKQLGKITLYRVIEITPRRTGNCIMDYLLELDPVGGVFTESKYVI